MSESQALQQALDTHGLPDTLSQLSSIHPCQGAKFHSPRPLSTRHWRFGDDVEVYLCPTCESNLEVLLHLDEQTSGLSWPVLREFGNQTRAIWRRILGGRNA